MTASEQEWLRIRGYLREHRYDLAVSAADEYSDSMRVVGTPLLAAATWIPVEPLPLDSIDLDFQPDLDTVDVAAAAGAVAPALPQRPDGSRYDRYSQVIGELAAPAVFENRPTYRLIEADLSRPSARLVFGRGAYFDGIDTGEASGHEYAATQLGLPAGRLRAAIADPCSLRSRPANLAISTLTIRHDRAAGEAVFLVHWRDPAKVGHAGGMYQVIPVGVFQPSGDARWNERNDFDLWRGMIREFDEELRGASEDYGSEQAPIDYAAWPFAARMTAARENGGIRACCLGLGVDPLTFATDLLTAVVIDAPIFDELFGARVTANAEGKVLAAQPFTDSVVTKLVRSQPMQAAGAALLSLAWKHRKAILEG
ncbi:MAG TPA: XRE family transcriptional regulator [Pseudonocardiaceae bacterium]